MKIFEQNQNIDQFIETIQLGDEVLVSSLILMTGRLLASQSWLKEEEYKRAEEHLVEGQPKSYLDTPPILFKLRIDDEYYLVVGDGHHRIGYALTENPTLKISAFLDFDLGRIEIEDIMDIYEISALDLEIFLENGNQIYDKNEVMQQIIRRGGTYGVSFIQNFQNIVERFRKYKMKLRNGD